MFPAQIAFNCIPNIGNFADSRESFEEQRITSEVKALLAQPDLGVSVTAVQVPVFSCHAISVNIELDNALDAESARDLLRGSPGVIVADDPSSAVYPQGVEVTGSAATHVGRIRNDSSLAAGLNLWIVVDNLRKSAALSVLRILQTFSEC